ncbi:MAG: hypothetical protein WB808_06290 [Candidatus Dormiibacterota bacterium]
MELGHLVLGMELDAELRSSLGIATPRDGDCQLIAVARVALPRARELLAFAAAIVSQHAHRDGSLGRQGAAVIAAAVSTSTSIAPAREVGQTPSEGAFEVIRGDTT